MCLNICFVAHEEPELIAELVQTMSMWVMTHTDGIKIILLHEYEIGQHSFLGNCLATSSVVFVKVCARDNAWNVVQEEEALRCKF